jgi:benzoyl-CoA reductase/2-hydroxyglutaryl-CoA dehydratase subunit BcrC/BadD/HgdB
MSELTGQEITKSMLDNWSAESHEKHRFPCQFLPAFIISTGSRHAFDVLTRRAGLFALPGPEALRAEIQRIDEEIKKKQSEKQKRQIFLKEIEHGS